MASPIVLADLRVALVMPVYNEADGIEEFLEEIVTEMRPLVRDLQIIIVDDCSTDQTLSVIEEFSATRHPEVRCQSNVTNRGHGPTSRAAYQAGLDEDVDVVAHVDGDGQFLGSEIHRAVVLASHGADVVIGLRQGRTDPWFRKVLTFGLRIYLRIAARTEIEDPNCPLRIYRTETLRALLPLVPEDSMVPSVYLSVLDHSTGLDLVEFFVRSLTRRGGEEVGTMWGGRRSRVVPSRRLASFVWGAIRESLTTIPRLRLADPFASGPSHADS